MNQPRHRPLTVGALRAFEAVARRLNFSAAASELHVTQPAISRQIRSLEDELGAPLFLRGTRHVELTGAGAALLRNLVPLLAQLDASVRQIRNAQQRQPVGVATFASLASLWLLPRLQEFQATNPESDIRVVASDNIADTDDPDIDLALRYCHADAAPAGSTRLFDEVFSPVASPALLSRQPLRVAADLARHTLIEGEIERNGAGYVDWRHWLQGQPGPTPEPRGRIYLNFTYQQIQTALAGQGVAIARMALVADSLARGDLIEPFGAAGRMASPLQYWLVRWPRRQPRPALEAFETWVLTQAGLTQSWLDAALQAPP